MKNKQILNFYFSNRLSFIGAIAFTFIMSINLGIGFYSSSDWIHSESLINALSGLQLVFFPCYFLCVYLEKQLNTITSKKDLLLSLGATNSSLNKAWGQTLLISSIIIYCVCLITISYNSTILICPLYIFISLITLSLFSIRIYKVKIYKDKIPIATTFISMIPIIIIIFIGYHIKDLLNDYWYASTDIVNTITLTEVTSKLNYIYTLIKPIEKHQYALILILSIPTSWYYYKTYKQLKSTINKSI